MPAAPLLSDAEIASRLAALPDWRLTDGRLTRTVTTRDFRSALELVTRIADPADEQHHHPDVAIHWNLVTLTLWTHASGGITERDFRLADAIERILSSPAG
ncbi:MAG: 4a-hydroxytetrahydrobiopterin dehydratase [Candidatus Limnocylindrales bacterium]|nr:4a-hydroxytetrahydrobiopterin dehydratase [Candidatus Limnocylindrales bacterium]